MKFNQYSRKKNRLIYSKPIKKHSFVCSKSRLSCKLVTRFKFKLISMCLHRVHPVSLRQHNCSCLQRRREFAFLAQGRILVGSYWWPRPTLSSLGRVEGYRLFAHLLTRRNCHRFQLDNLVFEFGHHRHMTDCSPTTTPIVPSPNATGNQP